MVEWTQQIPPLKLLLPIISWFTPLIYHLCGDKEHLARSMSMITWQRVFAAGAESRWFIIVSMCMDVHPKNIMWANTHQLWKQWAITYTVCIGPRVCEKGLKNHEFTMKHSAMKLSTAEAHRTHLLVLFDLLGKVVHYLWCLYFKFDLKARPALESTSLVRLICIKTALAFPKQGVIKSRQFWSYSIILLRVAHPIKVNCPSEAVLL